MTNNITICNEPVLKEIYKGYEPQGFILKDFLPVMSVQSRTGELIEVGTDHLRITFTARVGKSGTREINSSITKGTGWSIEDNGLKMTLTKEESENFDKTNWKNGQEIGKKVYTKMLKMALMLSREKALADQVQSNSVVTQYTTLTGGDQFDKYSTSDPQAKLSVARLAVFDACGFVPNTAIMSFAVYEKLKHHPKLKAIAMSINGNTSVRGLTVQELAAALEVEKLLIGKVKYNSAKQGATKSMTDVWGKHITLAYVNTNPSPEMFEYSCGYTFKRPDDADMSVDYWEETDPKDCITLRVTDSYDDMLVDPALTMYNIKDAVA